MEKKKVWIYEIHKDPIISEKCIGWDLQHAKHKGYEVIGISQLESSVNRRDSENTSKIKDAMLGANQAGANVVLTSFPDGFCRKLSEEIEKLTYCRELGMKFETTVCEMLEGLNYLDRCLFNSRFHETPLERIADLYEHYHTLQQRRVLSVRDDDPIWEQTL